MGGRTYLGSGFEKEESVEGGKVWSGEDCDVAGQSHGRRLQSGGGEMRAGAQLDFSITSFYSV